MTAAAVRNRDARSRRARRVAVAWTLVVVFASVVDPAVLLDTFGGGGAVGDAGSSGVVVDSYTVAHLVAYGVLAWLLSAGSGPGQMDVRVALVAVGLAAAAGVGVELLQAPLEARTASAADALVNGVGAVVGVLARAVIKRGG
ncbi:antibiotic resistance protein VanZ [Halobellus sp. Atlit-31R]|nr:antibiotic resistance protein VanZ [Halobellus sp. Atlit-31R]